MLLRNQNEILQSLWRSSIRRYFPCFFTISQLNTL